MTLSLPGMDVAQRIREDHDASQWFTPMPIARRMVAWAGAIKPLNILEPSAGSGNLVDAARERWPSANIDVVELDGFYAQRLMDRRDGRTCVCHDDFLNFRPVFDDLYDLCIANPPYEDGLDGRFLAHAMDLSERVIAMVRLAALAGQARHEDVWSRCRPEDGDFALRSVAIFSKWPRFESGRAVGDREDEGSAKADFCVVKLSRRAPHEKGREFPGFIEWWTP